MFLERLAEKKLLPYALIPIKKERNEFNQEKILFELKFRKCQRIFRNKI